MSTGALYTYFPSKVDLFTALAEWQVEERMSQFTGADPPELGTGLADAGEDVASLLRFVVESFGRPDESAGFTWFRSRTDVDARPVSACSP